MPQIYGQSKFKFRKRGPEDLKFCGGHIWKPFKPINSNSKCIKPWPTCRAVIQSSLEGCRRHEWRHDERPRDCGQGEDRVPRLGAVHRQRDHALREDLWQELCQRGRLAINAGWLMITLQHRLLRDRNDENFHFPYQFSDLFLLKKKEELRKSIFCS